MDAVQGGRKESREDVAMVCQFGLPLANLQLPEIGNSGLT